MGWLLTPRRRSIDTIRTIKKRNTTIGDETEGETAPPIPNSAIPTIAGICLLGPGVSEGVMWPTATPDTHGYPDRLDSR